MHAIDLRLSYGSLGRGDGRDLSGWPVQLRVYAVVHLKSATGSPVQPRAYAVAARNVRSNLTSPAHESRGVGRRLTNPPCRRPAWSRQLRRSGPHAGRPRSVRVARTSLRASRRLAVVVLGGAARHAAILSLLDRGLRTLVAHWGAETGFLAEATTCLSTVVASPCGLWPGHAAGLLHPAGTWGARGLPIVQPPQALRGGASGRLALGSIASPLSQTEHMHTMHWFDWGVRLMGASWRQARSPELIRRSSLASSGILLQATRWLELSGRRRRLELRSKNESFFPAAHFTLLIHLRCCARAAERTAGYAAPWKSGCNSWFR
jgi:hypothetical protein